MAPILESKKTCGMIVLSMQPPESLFREAIGSFRIPAAVHGVIETHVRTNSLVRLSISELSRSADATR